MVVMLFCIKPVKRENTQNKCKWVVFVVQARKEGSSCPLNFHWPESSPGPHLPAREAGEQSRQVCAQEEEETGLVNC